MTWPRDEVNRMRRKRLPWLLLSCALVGVSCSTHRSPPPKTAPAPKTARPPAGPTRTDFNTLAKTLVQRCVAGGWIQRWRAEHPNPDAARPRIYVEPFADATGQDLDPVYLRSTLERRMRVSNAFEMVAEPEAADFLGRGKLLRLAERSRQGTRISVYTVTLELIPTASGSAYSCEATVRGDL